MCERCAGKVRCEIRFMYEIRSREKKGLESRRSRVRAQHVCLNAQKPKNEGNSPGALPWPRLALPCLALTLASPCLALPLPYPASEPQTSISQISGLRCQV